MKTFQEYITESQMSVQDAQHLLGLKGSYSADELKAAYKRMAILHHPDKGGDVSVMQRINVAYDKLSNILGGTHTSPEDRMAQYHRSREEDRIFLIAALGKVKQVLNVQTFAHHFTAVFGEEFSIQLKETIEGNYASLSVEFANHMRSTVLDLRVNVSAAERHNTGLSHGAVGINMYVATSILHNRRKIKITQQNYRFEHDYSVLTNPESLFPAKKLGKKKDAKATKFSKKDAILSFQKELHAEFRDDWLYIPLPQSDGMRLALYRTVFMRSASWGINGVYQKSRRVVTISTVVTFPETEASMSWLIDHIKNIQKLKDPEEINHHVQRLASEYKANRQKIDPVAWEG